MEDDVTKLKKLAEQNRFDDAVKLHNLNPKQHHFNEYEILYTSFQFDQILHYAHWTVLTTGHNIMNVTRAINAYDGTQHNECCEGDQCWSSDIQNG